MAARERLPNRRYVETFDLMVAGLPYTCTVGRFADGRLAEVFLSNHKSNSAADTAARDAAIAFSFAVQHGADREARFARRFVATAAAAPADRWAARWISWPRSPCDDRADLSGMLNKTRPAHPRRDRRHQGRDRSHSPGRSSDDCPAGLLSTRRPSVDRKE